MEITRHFTATVLIVHQDRVLLHMHKKFNALLPVGGHIDRDELPEEAALREVKEEAGLAVALYNPNAATFPDVQMLVPPIHTLLIDVNEFHQHIDFIFYARAETAQVAPADGESNALHWYSRDEIQTLQIPENVRILALEALALLAESSSEPIPPSLEFRRHIDDLTYRYHPCELNPCNPTLNNPTSNNPTLEKPTWKREDAELWVVWHDEHGWVGVNAQQQITALPWGISIPEQGAMPPAGEWVSKKVGKSYVYDLVFI